MDILEIALSKLTEQFDLFVGECSDENGNPKAPSKKSLMIAKSCLPKKLQKFFPSEKVVK